MSSEMLCIKKCGFYGSPATRNLCSKCYQEFMLDESNTDSIAASLPKLRISNVNDDCMEKKKPSRCLCCKKKIGLLGFACRCGGKFCEVHRLPETHTCFFDYKAFGRALLAKEVFEVVSDKLEERI